MINLILAAIIAVFQLPLAILALPIALLSGILFL
jgi:hypothetical protein